MTREKPRMDIHLFLSQCRVEHTAGSLIVDSHAQSSIANFANPFPRIFPKTVLDMSQD